jgi:hypothetical protein
MDRIKHDDANKDTTFIRTTFNMMVLKMTTFKRATFNIMVLTKTTFIWTAYNRMILTMMTFTWTTFNMMMLKMMTLRGKTFLIWFHYKIPCLSIGKTTFCQLFRQTHCQNDFIALQQTFTDMKEISFIEIFLFIHNCLCVLGESMTPHPSFPPDLFFYVNLGAKGAQKLFKTLAPSLQYWVSLTFC